MYCRCGKEKVLAEQLVGPAALRQKREQDGLIARLQDLAQHIGVHRPPKAAPFGRLRRGHANNVKGDPVGAAPPEKKAEPAQQGVPAPQEAHRVGEFQKSAGESGQRAASIIDEDQEPGRRGKTESGIESRELLGGDGGVSQKIMKGEGERLVELQQFPWKVGHIEGLKAVAGRGQFPERGRPREINPSRGRRSVTSMVCQCCRSTNP